VQLVQVVPMVGAKEARLAGRGQQGSRGAALKRPRQVHGRLEVLGLPQLDVDLDMFQQPAHK
jgi:hypothetical protein